MKFDTNFNKALGGFPIRVLFCNIYPMKQKKPAKIKLLIAFFIAIALVASLLSGCSPEKVRNLGPKEAVIKLKPVKSYRDFPSLAGTPLKTIEEARKSTLSLIKAYLETAFLNLTSAKSLDFKEQVLEFYDEDSLEAAEKNISVLSLGEEGKRIDSITSNELQIPLIAINYDKSKKPSLSTVKFLFEAKYKAGKKLIKLKLSGWLAAENQGEDWKIFNYQINQELK